MRISSPGSLQVRQHRQRGRCTELMRKRTPRARASASCFLSEAGHRKDEKWGSCLTETEHVAEGKGVREL